MIKVKRALLSVSDKKGVVAFSKGLHALGVELISTGGTAQQLREAGLPVIDVADYTGFPEMLDGRVKTLHPKIHAGLLALRTKEHLEQLEKHGIGCIDMVVVNLYPFESVVAKKNVSFDEAIENIDIGGPTMLRGAAKNFKNVAVVCNPARYPDILRELDANNGLLPDTVLFSLAVEVFQYTSRYDTAIFDYLRKRTSSDDLHQLPSKMTFSFIKAQDLRYGENPHQAAAFYRDEDASFGFGSLRQRHGKELSFNNIYDLQAAVSFVKDFDNPAAVVIKHTNPTGLSEEKDLVTAYKNAWQADALSAFGGIVGLNRKVDEKTATLISKSGFMECVVAPAFSAGALKILTQKKNVRLVEFDFDSLPKSGLDFKKVYGGLLLQESDSCVVTQKDLKVVTKKKPTVAQLDACVFGWKAIRHVKSNAILLVKGHKIVGIGCGQTSRVESVATAIRKAGKHAKGAVLVSDAFLPKTDNVALAARAGITVIIQSGGSIADADVIAAANTAGIAMVTTGVRHFKH